MLVAEERKQELTLFPDQKAIMDVALHVASVLRNEESHEPDELGTIRLSRLALEAIITKSRELYGKGWSKHFRESSISAITDELTALLFDWEMLDVEPVTNAYMFKPLFGRVIGHYPKDFRDSEGEAHEQTS